MVIQKNFSLQDANTFRLPATAERYVSVQEVLELQAALRHLEGPVRILGGGSNILLTDDVPGWVIKNEIGGIAVEPDGPNTALLAAGGGVNWHELVLFALRNNLGGIENLSLIPGLTGASPIQNIGAYGVELKDVFHSLEAVELRTGQLRTFTPEECAFGYRDSFFKKAGRGKFCITKVRLRLTTEQHRLHLEYGAIRQTLDEMGVSEPTIQAVSQAVISIRQRKLPDPAVIGNAGSFFKNPTLSAATFAELQKKHPAVVSYPLPDGQVKVPAGWLIEQAGWKGHRRGQAGVHARQALVLVNYGGATGQEIHQLAQEIQASVLEKFGVRLTPEVNIW